MKTINHNTQQKERTSVFAFALKMAFVLMFFGLPNNMGAQDIQQYVFSSGGNYSSSPDMSVSWTLGDSFISTVDLDDQIYTQGFQQSFIKIREIIKPEILAFNASVYPNPTSGILNIKIENARESYRLEIYDVVGKLLHSSTEIQSTREIDLSNYHAGQYIIRLSNQDQAKLSVFEIIKL